MDWAIEKELQLDSLEIEDGKTQMQVDEIKVFLTNVKEKNRPQDRNDYVYLELKEL